MGGAMLSTTLIPFSVDGRGCAPSLLFGLKPNHGRVNEDVDLLQDSGPHFCVQCPLTPQQASHASARDSWTLPGKSGSVSCGDTAPFSWLLVHTRFCLCPQKVCFPQFCESSIVKSHWSPKSNSLGVLSPFAKFPGWEICCGS